MKRIKNILIIILSAALLSAVGLFISAFAPDSGKFSAAGSGTVITVTDDGGADIVMQASDDNSSSGDSITYNGTFDFDKEINVYVQPEQTVNQATHYLEVRLTNNGETVYFVEIGNIGTEMNIRTNVGYWNVTGNDDPIGPQKLTFVVKDEVTEFYYNGILLESGYFNKSNFASGKVGLKFTAYALTWWGGSTDKLRAHIRVGDPAATQSEARYVLQSEDDLSFLLDMNGAVIKGVEFSGSTTLSADESVYAYDGENLIFKSEELNKFLTAGEWTATVKNDAKDVVLKISVTDHFELETEKENYVYDKNSGQDLTVKIFKNADKFTSLTGSGIAEDGYSFDNATYTLTVNKEFLQGLASNDWTFYILSERNSQTGIPFTVTVKNTAPPKLTEKTESFDKYAPNDWTANFELFDNEFVRIEGEGITAEDWTFADGFLTLKKEFLSTLSVDEKTFKLVGSIGETEFTVNVVNTRPAELKGEGKVSVNIDSPFDAVFEFEIYDDEILSVTGNGIAAANWSANGGTLKISKEFIASSLNTEGEFLFTVTTKNGGNITVKIQTVAMPAPQLEGDSLIYYKKGQAANAEFTFILSGNELTEVAGEGIKAENYVAKSDENKLVLTFENEFLDSLKDGKHAFSVKFTAGEIVVEIDIENLCSPSFESGEKILYDVADSGDWTVKINAELGIFEGIVGNGITKDYYGWDGDNSALTIDGEFIERLSFTGAKEFTVNFDNGSLTLYVTGGHKADSTPLYTPMLTSSNGAGSVIVTDEDGFARVHYVRPATADFAGGVKFNHLFDVTKPIEVYVEFLAVPQTAGSSYVFTLSSEDYKMYYDNGWGKSELFGVFAVGEKYLQSGYFGVQPEDAELNMQISHELMKRSEDGFEKFVFDITDTSSKIYLNGLLIKETTKVTRKNFKDGLVYLLFTPHFWQDQEGTEFKIKAGSLASSSVKKAVINRFTKNTLIIPLEMQSSVVNSLELVCGDKSYLLNGWMVSQNYTTGLAELTLPAKAVLYRKGADFTKDLTLKIVSNTGSIDVPLVISDAEHLEIIEQSGYFDREKPADYNLKILANGDTVTSITGGGITAEDWSLTGDTIVIKSGYSAKLPLGETSLKIITEKFTEGIDVTLNVISSKASVISQTEWTFDTNNAEDIVINATLAEKHILKVFGNGISDSDYVFDQSGKITVKKEFLSRLKVDEYRFEIRDYFTADDYNVITAEIKVINTLKPLLDGESANGVCEFKEGGDDISVKIKVNNGNLLNIRGGYITKDCYIFDREKGEITFYKEWLESLPSGQTKIVMEFDNGNLQFVFEVAADEKKPAKKGCSAIFGVEFGLVIMSALTAAFVIKRK